MSDHDLERLAAKLHAMFCGCAAAPDEWCDSIWLVATERIAPILADCAADLRAIAGEWSL